MGWELTPHSTQPCLFPGSCHLQHQDLAIALHVSRPSFTWPFPHGVDHVWQAPNSLKLYSKILFFGNLLLLSQAGYNTSFSATTLKLRPQHHAASLQPLSFVLAVPSATWLTLPPPPGTSGTPLRLCTSGQTFCPELIPHSSWLTLMITWQSLCLFPCESGPLPTLSYELPRGKDIHPQCQGSGTWQMPERWHLSGERISEWIYESLTLSFWKKQMIWLS